MGQQTFILDAENKENSEPSTWYQNLKLDGGKRSVRLE